MRKWFYSLNALPLIGVVVSPIITISCGKDPKIDDPGDGEKEYNWNRSSKVVTIDNQDYLLVDNNVKYDAEFGYLNNLFEEGNTEGTVRNEKLNRRAYGRPYSFRGWTKELSNYDEKLYPDQPFQQSWKKLAQQKSIDPYKSTTANNGATFSLLDGINTSTANTPIAGVKVSENEGYALDYWQYIDVMNSWGGSHSEGYFQTPPADWINAAHRNGVPILGTFFSAPQVYGGVLSETLNLIRPKSDGTFPLADAMINLAEKNGFDGWVLNFETETGGANQEYQANFINWLNYLVTEAAKKGQIIQQYGSSSSSMVPQYLPIDDNTKSQIIDQNGHATLNQYLVDYRFSFGMSGGGTSSMQSDYHNLKEWGLSEAEIARVAAYGLEMERNGVNESTKNVLNKSYNLSKNLGTAGERNKSSLWSYTYRKTVDSKGPNEALKFWSTGNPNQDVRFNPLLLDVEIPNLGDYPSISNLYSEQTTLLKREPFGTAFNIGKAKSDKFYVDGKPITLTQYQKEGWTSMASQDILPTFRWWTDTYNDQGVRISGDAVSQIAKDDKKIIPQLVNDQPAYFGGSTLKYSGVLEANNFFVNKLYAIDFPIEHDDTFTITYQGSSTPKLALWNDQGLPQISSPTSTSEKNGWKVATFKISDQIPQAKAFGISYEVTEKTDLANDLTIGQITYQPAGYTYPKEESSFDQGYSQGVFASKNNGVSWENPAYRLGFDTLNNSDDLKFFTYSTKVGEEFVYQGLGGSMGIWINNLNQEDTIEYDGEKYFIVKVDYYRDDNSYKNSQQFLVKALIGDPKAK